tara:strand:+ start:372 stop:800 length:429 start_codon:yes stop_codon:yes gene_type:complete
MGFFSWIGNKIKTGFNIGKKALKAGVRLGDKLVNNPIVDLGLKFASPILASNPYGRAALLGIAGLKKGLEYGKKLTDTIEIGEKVAKTIQKPTFNLGDDLLPVASDIIKGARNLGDIRSSIRESSSVAYGSADRPERQIIFE